MKKQERERKGYIVEAPSMLFAHGLSRERRCSQAGGTYRLRRDPVEVLLRWCSQDLHDKIELLDI